MTQITLTQEEAIKQLQLIEKVSALAITESSEEPDSLGDRLLCMALKLRLSNRTDIRFPKKLVDDANSLIAEHTLMKISAGKPPRYENGCDSCTYLGQFNKFDLYFCPQVTLPTVIARFGNDGDYLSGMAFTDKSPPLGVALFRAVEAGLLPGIKNINYI